MFLTQSRENPLSSLDFTIYHRKWDRKIVFFVFTGVGANGDHLLGPRHA